MYSLMYIDELSKTTKRIYMVSQSFDIVTNPSMPVVLLQTCENVSRKMVETYKLKVPQYCIWL